MRFYIDHSDAKNPASIKLHISFDGGDVLKQAALISKLFPGERVSLYAMARTRAVFKDGELVREWPDINHFYDLRDKKPEIRAVIEHEWHNCIASSFDPEDYRRNL